MHKMPSVQRDLIAGHMLVATGQVAAKCNSSMSRSTSVPPPQRGQIPNPLDVIRSAQLRSHRKRHVNPEEQRRTQPTLATASGRQRLIASTSMAMVTIPEYIALPESASTSGQTRNSPSSLNPSWSRSWGSDHSRQHRPLFRKKTPTVSPVAGMHSNPLFSFFS